MGERTTYTAEYKSKIVIEILQGEHTISEIATRENVNVKQLSNWKREFPILNHFGEIYIIHQNINVLK